MGTCETCRFGVVHQEGVFRVEPDSWTIRPHVECRRYPVFAASKRTDDWCGEYQSARSPDDLAQSVLADLEAGYSLRKTAERQGTTLAIVRGVQKRANASQSGDAA